MKILDIYIILNPIGVVNAKYKVLNYDNKLNVQRLLINVNRVEQDLDFWDEVLFPLNLQRTENTFVFNFKRARFYSFAFKKIKRIFRDGKMQKVRIFFQNLECPLSNHIFFNYKDIFDVPVSFYVIEEGIANYYENYIAYPSNKRAIIKKQIFYLFFGFNIKIPFSQTGSKYDKVEKIFLSLPHLGLCPDKSFPLCKPNLECPKIEDYILLLGQESEVFSVGASEYIRQLFLLLDIIACKFPDKKVIYKPHWDSRINIFDVLGERLKIRKNFELLTYRGSVESIIQQNCPSILVSFSTSAFINIRIMLDEESNKKVQMYYFNAFNTPQEIIRLFSKINILPIDK